MAQLLVRPGLSADRKALGKLDAVAKQDPRRQQQLDHWISEGALVAAECGDVLVGYGVLEHTFFEHGFIAIIYVADVHRRQGVATRLIRHLEQASRTARVFTSTNSSNRPMQKLLASLGYRRSGEVQNLDPGDPEWIYVIDRAAKFTP